MQQNAQVLVELPENYVLSLARCIRLIFGKADEHFDSRRAPSTTNGFSDDWDEAQAFADAGVAGVKVCALKILICTDA